MNFCSKNVFSWTLVPSFLSSYSKLFLTPLWSHCYVQPRSGCCLLLGPESTPVCLSGKDRHRYDSSPLPDLLLFVASQVSFLFSASWPTASRGLTQWVVYLAVCHQLSSTTHPFWLSGVIMGNLKLVWELLMFGKIKWNRDNIKYEWLRRWGLNIEVGAAISSIVGWVGWGRGDTGDVSESSSHCSACFGSQFVHWCAYMH